MSEVSLLTRFPSLREPLVFPKNNQYICKPHWRAMQGKRVMGGRFVNQSSYLLRSSEVFFWVWSFRAKYSKHFCSWWNMTRSQKAAPSTSHLCLCHKIYITKQWLFSHKILCHHFLLKFFSSIFNDIFFFATIFVVIITKFDTKLFFLSHNFFVYFLLINLSSSNFCCFHKFYLQEFVKDIYIFF